jgi:Ribonuclease G/E
VVTTTTTTTALDRLQNRLATKSVRNDDRSRRGRTKSEQNELQPILEETLPPHTVGTIIRKAFKKSTLNEKITAYDEERE